MFQILCLVSHKSCIYIPGFNITLQWFGKTSTRLPESISFYFSPIQSSSRNSPENALKFEHGDKAFDWSDTDYTPMEASDFTWKLQKLGQIIRADSVMLNGSQYLHCKFLNLFILTSKRMIMFSNYFCFCSAYTVMHIVHVLIWLM